MGKWWGILIGAVLLGVTLWFALAGHVSATSGDGAPTRYEGSEPVSRDGSSRAAASPGPDRKRGDGQEEGSPAQPGDAGSCTLSGHVLDDNGQPLSGFTVGVLGSYVHIHRGVVIAGSATTDENGVYEVPCPSPGSYTVYADGPGYIDKRQSLEVSSDSTPRTLDFVLPFAHVVSGTVVDESGTPVSEVRVSLYVVEEDSEGSREIVSAESEQDGTFSLDVPEAGNYTVDLFHADYLLTEVPVTAPMTGMRLVLNSGTNVEVEVVDESGRPVEEARVRVQQEDSEEDISEETETTDETGKVTLKGFEPGKYVVMAVASAEGQLRTVKRELEFRGAGTLRVRLQLEAGARLSGIVVDGSNKPVEGAEVRVVPAALAEASGQDDAVLEPVLALAQEALELDDARPFLTGPDGRFTLNHVRPGTHVVLARKQGYVFDPQGERRRMMGEEPGVLVSAGASNIRLVMDFQGVIRGRVVREDGTPVTQFQINGGRMEDEQGAFLLPVERTEERVLTFSGLELAGTERKVQARRGETVELGDIVLHKGREVLVRVVNAETSQPVRGASVDLRTPEQDGSREGNSLLYRPFEIIRHADRGPPLSDGPYSTQEDGTARLQNVDGQSLRLRVSHPDYLPESMTLGDQQREVMVRLRSGARVEGDVRAGSAQLEDGIVVLLTSTGEVVDVTPMIDASYSLGPLRAGSYLLVAKNVRSDGAVLMFRPTPVRVPESGTLTVDLEAERSGTAVTVQFPEHVATLSLSPAGLSLPGSPEQLRRMINLGYQSTLSQEGRFRFQAVPPGHYTLFAVRDWLETNVEAHREEVEVPSRDTVTFTVRPSWVRLGNDPTP